MKNIKFRILFVTLLCILLPTKVYGASLSLNCPSSATVGDTISCTVTGSNSALAGVEGGISYSNVNYVSSSNLTGSNMFEVNRNSFSGVFDVANNGKNLASYTFNLPNVGTATISVSCQKMVDGSYASISCSGTSRLITVNPKPTTTTPAPTTTTTRKPTQTTTTKAPTTTKDKKTTTSKDKTTTKNNEPSKDVNLKNIAINNNNLNFDPQKDTYDIEVSNDVEKADIKVELSDNKASLKIDGNTNLKIGSNIIKIIVTAEDNSVTKTYTLNIIRKDKNAVLSNNTYIRKLKINGYKLNFNKNTKSYELTIGNEKKLDIMVITEDSLSSYKIIGNDKLKDKNIIKIVVTAENGEIDTYSITINKEKNYNYLLYIIIAILVIINIILTILLIKKNKKQDNDTQNLNTTIQDVQIPEEVVKEENQILEETEISKSIDNFEEQEMLEIEDLNDEIDKAFDDTFNDEMNSND